MRNRPSRQTVARPGLLRRALPLALLAPLSLLAGGAGCREVAPQPPEARLSTDLPPDTADQVLRSVLARGGPRTERVAGQGVGAAALRAAQAALAASAAAQAGDVDGGPAPETKSAGTTSAGTTSAGTTSAAMKAAEATAADAKAPAPESAGDVRWDLEPYGAITAAARGELLPMPSTGEDVPDLWRDQGGTWVAVGGRAQVLLVAITLVGDHPTPSRFTALTEPWLKGRVAIAAPIGGAALAHFAALYEAWGEERMNAWLKALRANDVQVLPDDASVRKAVIEGRAVVGLLGSDEAAKAAASAARVEVVYPNQRSIGTFVWPTALSRPRNPAHPEAAARLSEKLADRLTEQLLVAREPGFLPLRKDIPVPPGVRSAANLVVISVSPARIVEQIELRRPALVAWARN